MGDATSLGDFDEITAHELRQQGSVKWTRHDGDTIGAAVAEMDFPVARAIQSAVHTAVDHGTFGYLPPQVAEALAHSCAEWQQRRFGWSVDPAHVWPVADVMTAYTIAIEHMVDRERPLIVPTPTYMGFFAEAARQRREVIEVPMVRAHGRYALDLDRIDEAFRAGGEMVVLCQPVNPVGRVFTPSELTALAALVDHHGGTVFSDEVHGPLTYPDHPHTPYASTSPTAYAHTLTAVSTSKAWNIPGVKCAEVVVPPALAAQWRAAGTDVATVWPSTLGAVAATAAYRHGERWLDEVLGYLDRNRRRLAQLLAAELPQVGYEEPEGTYLAWWDCRAWPTLGHESPAAMFADEAGVAVTDGRRCGTDSAGFVRVNFATPLPILEQLVTRLAHCVHRSAVRPSRDRA